MAPVEIVTIWDNLPLIKLKVINLYHISQTLIHTLCSEKAIPFCFTEYGTCQA